VGARQDEFTVVLLPDTQYYSLRDAETYRKQTEWVVANRASRNIKAVIHLGDITHKNTINEWTNAHQAHVRLDNAGVPYSVTTGNHDYPYVDDEERRRRDPSRFNSRFGPARFAGKAWYGGHYGSGNASNFTLFDHNGLEFIVVSLEYAPPKDAMCWASSILRGHATRRAIVATHCYQGHGGGLQADCGIRDNLVGASGDVLWQELIRQHNNVFLVLSGHVGDSEHKMHSRVSGLYETTATAATVHEILTDYQFEKDQNGLANGNGWLRTLTFHPNSNRVDVDVHSVLNRTAFNRDDYSHDPGSLEHKFPFAYDMTTSPPNFGPTVPPLNRFADRHVNSNSTRHQRAPRVAVANNGDWVAVWEDDSRGDEGVYQIHARGFDANGCERFREVTVNVVSDGQQLKPAIAMDPRGNFVVAWEDDADGNGYYQIKARGFNTDGTQRFAQRTVNPVEDGQQRRPAIAMDAQGNFVVAWEDDSDRNAFYQIKARGFNSAGNQSIAQFTVNSTASGQQRVPAIAMNASGDFVIVWEDDNNENSIYQIKARGFNATGGQRFAQRTVNAVADGQQRSPAVAMDALGGFVVVWQDDSNENEIYQVKARGFDATGAQRFNQITVNTVTSGQQLRPAIAGDANGRFVVTWDDDSNENGVYNVRVRGFDERGNQLLSQRTANHNLRGEQRLSSVALTQSGGFVIVWQDDLEKNGRWEILGVGCSLAEGCRY
jgi:hypothetical protein